MAHQYAAATAAVSPNYGNKQAEGNLLMHALLWELIIQDPLTPRKGQMKFSHIKLSFFSPD